jgi:hypothetical protein
MMGLDIGILYKTIESDPKCGFAATHGKLLERRIWSIEFGKLC